MAALEGFIARCGVALWWPARSGRRPVGGRTWSPLTPPRGRCDAEGIGPPSTRAGRATAGLAVSPQTGPALQRRQEASPEGGR